MVIIFHFVFDYHLYIKGVLKSGFEPLSRGTWAMGKAWALLMDNALPWVEAQWQNLTSLGMPCAVSLTIIRNVLDLLRFYCFPG